MSRLVEAGEVDNYLLFTNRRLGGEAESKIIRELREETGIPNLAILGLEKITEFLIAHPEIVRRCGIDLFKAPLRFHAEDIKRVILAFHHQKATNRLADVLKKFIYRELEEKNEINQLQREYFDVIKGGSEAYFKQISTFLGDPINAAIAEIYGDFAAEINYKIELRRDEFAHFAEVFEFLYTGPGHIARESATFCGPRTITETFFSSSVSAEGKTANGSPTCQTSWDSILALSRRSTKLITRLKRKRRTD